MTETTAPPAAETDAAFLRRAAALICERAQAAAAGPWSANRYWLGDHEHWRINGPVEGGEWAEIAGGYNGGGIHTEGDARHIASWHPIVVHAVADWLDAEADCQEQCTAAAEGVRDLLAASTGADHRLYVSVSTLDQALNVARIVLGEAA